jgi:NitT/TauT family transport system substrate-binding protein
MHIRRSALGAALALAIAAGTIAGTTPAGSAAPAAPGPSSTLRLGYFPNVTHAAALVGAQGGLFKAALGPNVTLKLSTFSAGPAAVEALLSNSVDASYVGPNPAINAFVQSQGAVRIVAGAASGGAFLVVRPGITKAADLKGKVLASPQLGNTQDVALRTWLKQHGLKTSVNGGGDTSIRPEDNAVTLQAFEQHQIDGAWVPEPWATRLVTDGGGKVLLDERTLWPRGRFATTELVVRTDYLKAHADVIQSLLEGQVDAVGLIQSDPTRAEQLVAQGIQAATGQSLRATLIAASFGSISFTNDPIASSLRTQAQQAHQLGLLASARVNGIFDVRILNRVLRAKGKPAVSTS